MQSFNISPSLIASCLGNRPSDSHKGNYGHVLIVAGSRGMTGAAVLAAWGALRSGAGLVSAAIPESQQPIVAQHLRPEAMTVPLPETEDGTLSETAVPILLEQISKKKIATLVIGPGLSRQNETQSVVRKLLKQLSETKTPLKGTVLDADGFIALKGDAQGNDWLQDIDLPLIVTPHLGEMSHFTGIPVETLQANRSEFAEKFAKLYSVVCVLKGVPTQVTDEKQLYLNETGNPGMATGGSGDVLSGMIGAFLAGLVLKKEPPAAPLFLAAVLGTYIHGLAGDEAAKEKTETSLIAGDIAEAIPKVLSSPHFRTKGVETKPPFQRGQGG